MKSPYDNPRIRDGRSITMTIPDPQHKWGYMLEGYSDSECVYVGPSTVGADIHIWEARQSKKHPWEMRRCHKDFVGIIPRPAPEREVWMVFAEGRSLPDRFLSEAEANVACEYWRTLKHICTDPVMVKVPVGEFK